MSEQTSTATTTIESYVVHAARCSACGQGSSNRDLRTVEQWRDAHEHQHVQSAERAGRIVGQVFDIDAPGVPWLGHIDRAREAAWRERKPYLLWNGNVYAVNPHVDLSSPVCSERDWRAAEDDGSGS